MRCVQTGHRMHSGLRARTDQRHAPVAVLLHLKALPAALAVLHRAHVAGLCPLPRWGRPQCSLPRELDNRRPKALRPALCATRGRPRRCGRAVLQIKLSETTQGSSWAPLLPGGLAECRQARLWRRLQLRAQLGQLRLELAQVVLRGLPSIRQRLQYQQGRACDWPSQPALQQRLPSKAPGRTFGRLASRGWRWALSASGTAPRLCLAVVSAVTQCVCAKAVTLFFCVRDISASISLILVPQQARLLASVTCACILCTVCTPPQRRRVTAGSVLLQDSHDCDRTACGPLLP
jgi:hypothetical protein